MNKQNIKYVIVVLIIVLAGYGIYQYTDYLDEIPLPQIRQSKETSDEQETAGLDLPEAWTEVEDLDDALVGLTRETDSQIATNVVFTQTEEIDYEDPKDYTDQLIAGTKSALTSLNYATDEIEENDYYIRKLTGSYWQAGTRIGIKQNIYLAEDVVYVITASYDQQTAGEGLTDEINQIFELLAEEYISE